VSYLHSTSTRRLLRWGTRIGLLLAGLVVVAALVWQGISAGGNPDPTAPHLSPGAAILDTGLLVFREGLETILVLAAITASMMGGHQPYRRPVAMGAGLALLATLITWFIVVGLISAVDAPALSVQAGTGLLAIVVLLVIMNWFFHRVYWTGWISFHNRRRRNLLLLGEDERSRLLTGMALLGFTSVYREGFEVVLFLQSLRLQVGSLVVLEGVLIGLAFTAIVGLLTFVAHHRLPYKKMLVLTGVMLGVVLLVMVGENVQEMQQAGWIGTTPLPLPIPDWMGLWFAVFPNLEGLVAQALAAILVIGSYLLAEYVRVWRPRRRGEQAAQPPEAPPTLAEAPATRG
jgi:high-affinity iron transporter